VEKADYKKWMNLGGLFLLSLLILVLALQTAPWAKSLFSGVCHQDPLRSFSSEAGMPMAVCSRCLGFYVALCCNWLLVSFVFVQLNKKEMLYLFALCWAINLLDVLFNSLAIWQNTLESRFFAGLLIAFPIAFLFKNELPQLTLFKS
jgi:uncharacterized membrane protein